LISEHFYLVAYKLHTWFGLRQTYGLLFLVACLVHCAGIPRRQITYSTIEHLMSLSSAQLSAYECAAGHTSTLLLFSQLFLPDIRQGKVLPYLLPSVGPGADPGVQAICPQVTFRHPPGGRLPLLSTRHAVTYLAFTRWCQPYTR